MSAIFGFINLNNNEVNEELFFKMVEPYKKYKIDSYKYVKKDNVIFGCGMQYITPESISEELPFYDKENSILITADAIIDNREELGEYFNLNINQLEKTSDSELILKAYLKWGEDCTNYLVGDFSFAIWDENKNKLLTVRDHTGKRTFYYYKNQDIFVFSTIISPLLEVMNNEVKLNDRWISDFLTIPGLLHQSECEETVYKDIYQILPAYKFLIDKETIKKINYWNPIENREEILFQNDEEYVKAFMDIYSEAIRCRLRGNGKIGISLSGGLDSTSIAAVAAPILKSKGENLKAFTSIPYEEFKSDVGKYRVADEREYIELLKKMYANIETNYIDYKDKDAFSVVEEAVELLEQPYKIMQNMPWLIELDRIAMESDCRVVLTGQNGNNSISYGDYLVYTKTLFQDFKFINLFREIDAFSKRYQVPKKIVLKGVSRAIVNKQYKNTKKDKYEYLIVNKNLEKAHKSLERLKFNENLLVGDRFLNHKETLKTLINPLIFNHIAEVDTKLTLAYGICRRDPTRDKRVIEFCLSLPANQFVRDGEERNLIRRAMKGLLPEEIRLNRKKRGLQGADWLERVNIRWDNLYKEIRNEFSKKALKNYLDIDKLNRILEKNHDGIEDGNELMMICCGYIFSKFINRKS